MTPRDPLSLLPKGLPARILATLGGPITRRMAHWGRLLEQINALEPVLQGESDAQLRKRSLSLKFRAKSGERLDRMLVETDSPYLAPVPHRGKPNRPTWVAHVGQHIADLRDIAVAEVASATTANARAVFALAPR